MPSLALCLLGLSTVAAAPRVGVLVEPGMVRYGVQPTLRAARLPGLLRRHGLEAVELRAGDLTAETLRPDRLPVLVMPYGNAFPLPAYEALRAYHRAGGGLVLCGIPFCHPAVPEMPAGWRTDGDLEQNACQWTDAGRAGRHAIWLEKKRGGWLGATGPGFACEPGRRYLVSGWVRSAGLRAETDYLFVRFFSAGGSFLGQQGPALPADAPDWVHIRAEVTVPAEAVRLDVSLQMHSPSGSADISEPSLVAADDADRELLANSALDAPGDQWRDAGHTDRYFGPEAMGTGSFAGPAEGRLAVAAGNVLGLTPAMLRARAARHQWIDEASLPPGAEVLPLVTLETPDGARPLSALIRQPFGARDVWLGQAGSELSLADRFFCDQAIVRGVAWSLAERNLLPADAVAALHASLDAQPVPQPLPDQIDIVDEPRPWGDSFFPKCPPPARRMLAVDCRGMDAETRLAYISLQGITGRTQPRLWLYLNDWDPMWLDWHRERGDIDSFEVVADPATLFARFGNEIKGAVLPDPGQYQGRLLAATLAGLEDLIVAPPELAERLGLPVRIDLRGRFETYAEGLEWLWTTYRDRLCHHELSYSHPDVLASGSCDYEIAHRALLFWISGEKDGDQPGADPVAEAAVMAQILAALPPNIGMRGFPWHGDGFGMGEGGGVEFCGAYGKGLVCCNLSQNMSVTSGVRMDRLEVPPAAPPQPLVLDRSKVYIALTMSDGDNLNTWQHFFHRHFEHPAHGRIPMGWGMGPAALDLIPGIADWYYRRAAACDEFVADVSGIFYVFPETYGSRYRERDKVFDGYLRWTADYMRRTGMRTIRPHGGSPRTIQRMAEALPFCHSIFADYARRGLPYEQAVYALPDGRPVFHALTHWLHGRDGLLRDIREQVGDRRPAFVNGFLHNWTFDMDAIQAAVDGKDADMEFVTMSQLAELYRQQ